MYVELFDEEDVRDAIEELLQSRRQEGGATRSHVRVQLDLPLRQLTRESLQYFFECIGADGGTAVELCISSRRIATRTDELAFILEQGPNLSHLEIDELSLCGGNIEQLARALSSQRQLRTVYLNDVRHVDAKVDLTPLAAALCHLDHLEALELYNVRFSQNALSNQRSLASISRWSRAKTLEVMPCVDRHLEGSGLAVTRALLRNPTLERLCLVTRILPQTVMFQDSVLISLAGVLQSNRTNLQEIEINVCETINLVPLVEALKHNTMVKALSFCWDAYSVPVGKNLFALREMLRDHNFTLQRLNINLKDRDGVFGKEWTDPAVEFYLRLNQMGRRSLIRGLEKQSGTAKDWIQILSKCTTSNDDQMQQNVDRFLTWMQQRHTRDAVSERISSRKSGHHKVSWLLRN